MLLAFESGQPHSCILWGPPGTGKTTIARLMADAFEAQFITISAVLGGIKDIREAVSQKSKEWTAFTAEVKTQAGLLFGFVALFWAVFAVDTVLGGALRPLGIHPRTTQGLWGILAAPLLHGGLFHIVPNTVGFLALGWLVMLRDTRHFVLVTLAGVVVGGMTAWLLGSLVCVWWWCAR